jgi:GT2 family glycosyltransferase
LLVFLAAPRRRLTGLLDSELAVIVLNYRTPELTLDCLASLETEVDGNLRVVVVDNDSRDGSAERFERVVSERGWSSWAQVLRSPINGGFAAGTNFGISSIDADAYVLLNSDTIVRPGAIAGMRRATQARPDAGLIGPCLLNREGNPDHSLFRNPAPATDSVIGANTVVLRDLPPSSTVFGVPARPVNLRANQEPRQTGGEST